LHYVAAHRERFERSRELLDSNLVDNIERGLALSLGDVSRAHVEQTKLYKRFLAFFEEVDVLICPAASVSPFPHLQSFVEQITARECRPTCAGWPSPTGGGPTVAAPPDKRRGRPISDVQL
jgi:amidase